MLSLCVRRYEMRGTKLTETIGLVVISLLIAATTGCGNKEGKYVGTYIEEDKGGTSGSLYAGFKTVLELSPDGTYRYQPTENSVTTGEWKVVKSRGKEDIEFIPEILVSLRQTKKRGYCFELLGGGLLVKEEQARRNRLPNESSQPSAIAMGSNEGKVTTTKPRLRELHTAVNQFKMDTGRFPSEDEGLRALVEPPADASTTWPTGGYLQTTEVPKDAWGHEFIYELNPESGKPFVIKSLGADGKEGGNGLNADLLSTDS
jgi:general secretion pathway protein G